jgi:peptidoglycan-N-acetylglucosamine deacetylase
MDGNRFVTTSWDDGDQLDLKLADLLESKGIRATFYVPVHATFRPNILSPNDIRRLSDRGFEIGAHGATETPLRGLSGRELAAQIGPCRPALEDVLGKAVQMFSYCRGSYDHEAMRAVEEAGFLGARSNRMLATQLTFPRFEMPTTVQSFPHPRGAYLRNAAKGANAWAMRAVFTNIGDLSDWVRLGKKLFDSVLPDGGVWHLYGHSWEIEERKLWEDLGEVLDYVRNRSGVTYVTNAELVANRFAQPATVIAPVTVLEVAVPEVKVLEVEEPTKTVEAGR